MQALLRPRRASAALSTLAMIKLAMSRTELPTTRPVSAACSLLECHLTWCRLRPAPAFSDARSERRRNPPHVRLLLAREATELRPQQDLRAVRNVALGLKSAQNHSGSCTRAAL